MKKSLFALAAVGAFAGAAQAQSSVTVYGILDVGYTGANERVSAATANGAAANANINTNVSRISNSMESGSRLGFRGNEDMGGGTSAQFVVEFGLQPAGNQGSNAAGNTGTTGATFAGTYYGQGSSVWNPDVRQAFVGLSQKGMGQIRIGTQNTLFWEQGGSNTAGQLSQTAGSMLAPSIVGPFTVNATNGGSSASYTVRTTNTVTLRTERMAGVVLKAGYTLSNQTARQTAVATGPQGYAGGQSDQSGYQAAFDWNIQKANIQGSYAVFTSEGPFDTTATGINGTTYVGSTSPVAWGTGLQGTNVKDGQALITGSYDFGILKAYIGWTQRKVTANYNSNVYLKRTAQEIGVRGYATKTIEYWGSVGNGRWSAFGLNQPTANIFGYQAGANYWMSKRTNLYAIYGQNGTSTTSNGAASVSQYSLGVRHTF